MLHVIADDLTGACDVGAELAAAGLATRIAADVGSPEARMGDALTVVNTQSRALTATAAYQRVLDVVRPRPADLVLKKIDTALRGHLGAELEAAVEGLGAIAAFVLPAIPAAERVTRDGCQWFVGRLLATTEFADDPEGAGAESSIAAVLARESRRRTEVIGTRIVRAGGLRERARALLRAGAVFFVVDAETDDDLDLAVAEILDLPRPLCLAGSIALTRALTPHLEGEGVRRTGQCEARSLATPALIVSGSLHPMARIQVEAAVTAGLAAYVGAPANGAAPAERAAAVTQACVHLRGGRSVVVAPAPAVGATDAAARRATERSLADLSAEVLQRTHTPTLVLIGGETSHAVLGRLGATDLKACGRVAPLVAIAEVVSGPFIGTTLVTKGGSGGEPGTVAALLRDRAPIAAARASGGSV